MNYRILMTVTGVLVVTILLIGFFTDFWGETNYPDYINTVLGVFFILFATQVFSKEKKED